MNADTRAHIHAHIHTHMKTHTCMRAHTCAHTHARTHTNMPVHTNTNIVLASYMRSWEVCCPTWLSNVTGLIKANTGLHAFHTP